MIKIHAHEKQISGTPQHAETGPQVESHNGARRNILVRPQTFLQSPSMEKIKFFFS